MWVEITKENVGSLPIGCSIRYIVKSEFTDHKGSGTFTKFTNDTYELVTKVWGHWDKSGTERYVRLDPMYNLEYFHEVTDLDQDDDDCV